MTSEVQSSITEEGAAPASLVEEYKLLVDADGKYKDELAEKFESYRKEIKAKMQKGCKQDDYVLCVRLLESIDMASSVVEKVWKLAKEQNQVKGESDIFEEAIGQ
ncbi:MAG: hypothetical protein P8176_05870 [Gammaproteobacteria bacterium]